MPHPYALDWNESECPVCGGWLTLSGQCSQGCDDRAEDEAELVDEEAA